MSEMEETLIGTNQQEASQHLRAPGENSSAQTLRQAVETAMRNYFAHLDGQEVSNLYELVLAEVEAPLLEIVMSQVRSNQTKAATLLGVNRGTLRKKLKQYDML